MECGWPLLRLHRCQLFFFCTLKNTTFLQSKIFLQNSKIPYIQMKNKFTITLSFEKKNDIVYFRDYHIIFTFQFCRNPVWRHFRHSTLVKICTITRTRCVVRNLQNSRPFPTWITRQKKNIFLVLIINRITARQ